MEYKVISQGAVMAGADPQKVLENLATAFRLGPDKAQAILARRLVLKRFDNEAAARAFAARLRQQGVAVTVSVGTPPVASQPLTAAEAPAAVAEPVLSEAAIAGAFAEKIPALPLTAGYRLQLLLVCLAALTAPVIYLGLLLALLWLGWLYLGWAMAVFAAPGSITGKIFLTGTSGFLLAVITTFLIAPLFARPRRPLAFPLQRKQAPLLYLLVESLAQSMGIAPPQKIIVNNEVNASAGAEGLWSLIRGGRVLTIGLPLVAGLDSRQLTFVLAHEFGHFSQRAGLLSYQLISRVNYWFWDRAQSSHWEQRLNAYAERFPLLAVQLSLWLAALVLRGLRWLFAGLAKLNLRLTLSMSRQMEFDADAYGAYVAGSSQIGPTSRQVNCLALAEEAVQAFNLRQWQDDLLLANLAEAMVADARSNQHRYQKEVEQALQQDESHPWASHPPSAQRIKAGEAHGFHGVFHLQADSRSLFRDFAGLCQNVTLFEYRQHGIEKPQQYLIDEQQQQRLQTREAEEDQVHNDYFNDLLFYRLFVLAGPATADADGDWQAVVDELRQRAEDIRRHNGRYHESSGKLQELALANRLCAASIKVDMKSFHVNEDKGETLESVRQQYLQQRQSEEKHLKALDQLWQRRFSAAIAALSGEQKQEATALYAVLQQIRQSLATPLRKLIELEHGYQAVYHWAHEEGSQPAMLALLEQYRLDTYSAAVDVQKRAETIDCQCGQERYNFGEQLATLSGGRLADADQVGAAEVGRYADAIIRTAWRYYFRILYRLGWLCQQAERDAGIRPIRLLPRR